MLVVIKNKINYVINNNRSDGVSEYRNSVTVLNHK